MDGGVPVVAGLLVAVLAALSGLHVYWGVGGLWPASDPASLAATVVGTRGGVMPGLAPSLFVAACLVAVAAFVAWRAGWLPALLVPGWMWSLGFWGAAFVFAARGVAGFVPAIFSYADGTPFQRLNLIFYSPLCLAIAAAMAALWWMTRPSAA